MATRAERLKAFARGIQSRIDARARQLAEGGRVRMVGRKPEKRAAPKKPAAKVKTIGRHPKLGRIVRAPDGKTYAVKGGRVVQVKLRKPTLRERARSKVEKLKAFARQKVRGAQARLDTRARELVRGGRTRAIGALQGRQARPASPPTKPVAKPKRPTKPRPESKPKRPTKPRPESKPKREKKPRLTSSAKLQLLREAKKAQKAGRKIVANHPTHGPMMVGPKGGIYVISKRTGAKLYI